MPEFNATEEKFLRYLHEQYVKGNDLVLSPDCVAATGVTPEEQRHIESRLVRLEVIEFLMPDDKGRKDCDYLVNGRVCELVSELDHRPLVNHWQRFLSWWFSKRWSMPLTALVLLAPIVAQWCEWAYKCYMWYKGNPPTQTQ